MTQPRNGFLNNTSASRLFAGGLLVTALVAGGAGYLVARATPPAATITAAPEAQAEPGHVEGEAAKLTLSPSAITSAGIVVETIQSGGLAAEILASAAVTAPPGGQALLTARAAGAVTRINKRLGDTVRQGEVLATVESREASQIAADRGAAAAKATLAQRNLARERSLFQQRVSPRVDLEAAEAEAAVAAAEARRASAAASAAGVTADGRNVVVVSPISGQITSVTGSLGAYVQPETELFRIADPRRIQVEAAVSGADAPRIRAGDRAVLELADGMTLPARVRSITASLGAETRAATAVLEPVGGALRLGQTLRARIYPARASATGRIVVPEEAVQSVAGRDAVFIRTADGFVAQPVTTAQRSAGRIEIVDGLKAGAMIATTNAFVLKAELGKGAGEEE